jgi:hypothetical protein
LVLAIDGFQPFEENYKYTTKLFLVAPVTAPPAMDSLVDELNHLNLNGIKVHDAATDEVVLIHVKLVRLPRAAEHQRGQHENGTCPACLLQVLDGGITSLQAS